MESHYDVLGVHPQAPPDSIRSAYLLLVKRLHPDAGAALGEGGRDLARINLAYSVLRDPSKRASYDADLRHMRAMARVRSQANRQLPVIYTRKRRMRPGRSVALAALVLAGLAILNQESLRDFVSASAGYWRMTPPERIAMAEPIAPIFVNPRVQEAVAIASDLSSAAAETMSRRCFEQAQTYPSVSIVDQCIAFDLAFANGHPAEASAYFEPSARERRNLAALVFLGPDLERRARLRAVTDKAREAIVAFENARSEGVLPPVDPGASFPK